MKAFFEEYGLVLVVIVVVGGMLALSDTLTINFQDIVSEKWAGHILPGE